MSTIPKLSAEEKREQLDSQERALGAFGASAQGSFRHAWELFVSGDEAKRIEGENLAAQLLRYPELGDLHKAGCHVILAHGVEDYLYHAEQALDIYKNLYVVRSGGSYSGSFTPTDTDTANQQTLINLAQKVYAKAKGDHAQIEAGFQRDYQAFVDHHGREPTDDELVKADMKLLPESFHHGLNEYAEAMRTTFEEPIPAEEMMSAVVREDWEDIDEEIEIEVPQTGRKN